MSAPVYPLIVDGVGAFEARRRTLRTEIQIGVEYARLTEGQESIPNWLQQLCEMVATVKVLIVAAPPGWEVDAMDPREPTTYDRLQQVYRALGAQEDRFRHPPAPDQSESAPAGSLP